MDEATQQNAALVEEAAAAAQSLEDQAGKLRQAVAGFQGDERSAGGAGGAVPRGVVRREPVRGVVAKPARVVGKPAALKVAAKLEPVVGAAAAADWQSF